MQEDSTDQILQALAAKPSGPPGRRRFAAVIAVAAVALVLVALFGIGLVPRLSANRAIAEVAKDSLHHCERRSRGARQGGHGTDAALHAAAVHGGARSTPAPTATSSAGWSTSAPR